MHDILRGTKKNLQESLTLKDSLMITAAIIHI